MVTMAKSNSDSESELKVIKTLYALITKLWNWYQ